MGAHEDLEHDLPLLRDGCEAGSLRIRDEPAALRVLGLVVDPAERGRGVGSAAVRDLVARGRAVLVDVPLSDPDALGFWVRCGFRGVASDGNVLTLQHDGTGGAAADLAEVRRRVLADVALQDRLAAISEAPALAREVALLAGPPVTAEGVLGALTDARRAWWQRWV